MFDLIRFNLHLRHPSNAQSSRDEFDGALHRSHECESSDRYCIDIMHCLGEEAALGPLSHLLAALKSVVFGHWSMRLPWQLALKSQKLVRHSPCSACSLTRCWSTLIETKSTFQSRETQHCHVVDDNRYQLKKST